MEWQKWWATNSRRGRSGHGRNDRPRSPFAGTAAADLMRTCFAVEGEGWRKKKNGGLPPGLFRSGLFGMGAGCKAQNYPKLSVTPQRFLCGSKKNVQSFCHAIARLATWWTHCCSEFDMKICWLKNILQVIQLYTWKQIESHAAEKGHKPRITARDPQEIPAPMGWW